MTQTPNTQLHSIPRRLLERLRMHRMTYEANSKTEFASLKPSHSARQKQRASEEPVDCLGLLASGQSISGCYLVTFGRLRLPEVVFVSFLNDLVVFACFFRWIVCFRASKMAENQEKEKSPSSRFETDLTNYKPGLIVTDPRHIDFLEIDSTPILQRLEKASEARGGSISDSFESYVSKSFASAHDRFDSDPTLRRISTDTKLQPKPAYTSKYAKSQIFDSGDDDHVSGDNLAAFYDAYEKEKLGKYEFEVYQPKSLGRYGDSRSGVHIREIHGKEKEWSPPNLDQSISSYKSAFARNDRLETPPPKEDRHAFRSARERQVMIDTSKYGHRSATSNEGPSSYPRNEYLRKNDSMYVGSNFIMLTLRSPDRWYDKVDKLLKEARDM